MPITPHNLDPIRDIVVVSATDDAYAMPLAVTIRSALDHLAADRRLRLYILDGGLSDESKSRLLRSWNDPRIDDPCITVEWLQPDMSRVADLMVSEQVNVVTYLRILMPLLLPSHITRAIYIDADMLVRRDLAELWDEPQDGYAVLAAPDVAAPYLDAAKMLPNFGKCRPYLAHPTPIANFRELGLPGDARYFNGGLLVADIAQWRRENFAATMLCCLHDYREHILWWDQYALNIVLARHWRPLDDRWNQGAHLYVYPTWQHSPLDRATYMRLKHDPWIVHFCSPSKPWHYFCHHPFQRDFYRVLDHTDWQGWRPERPDNFFRTWWDFHYRPLRAEWKRHTRAVKNSIRGKRKAA